MSDQSKIEWTDSTWNPVTGCTKVSAGCDHCYAETITERFHGKGSFEQVQLHPDRLAVPLRWRKPRRVFVNSMSDLFHDAVPTEYIARAFAVMSGGHHRYQILTKRHGRMRALLRSAAFTEMVYDARNCADWSMPSGTWPGWPLPNVWLGVSVEDQRWADVRIPALLGTPAAVRFLSCEPLLGPVDLWRWIGPEFILSPLHWVIVGGESGRGARPMHPDWARSLRDQCVRAGVPFLFKQWGEWGPAPWSVRVCDPKVGWQGTAAELAEAKRDAEARAATHCHMGGHLYRPDHKPWSLERDPDGDYPGAIRRWGKKRAGRELDGRTWDEFPEVVSC